MSTSLVSVLIPCHNAEKFVGETLESVFGQTWPSLHVVLVDDGSSDSSLSVARSFAGSRLNLLIQPNRGAPGARNKALEQAVGEYCIFLDADDLFEESFVQAQVEAMAEADADICFGCSLLAWPDGRREEKESMPAASSLDFALSQVLTGGWYPPHAVLWRTSFLRDIGGWNESLRRNEDGELIARALLQEARITSSKGARAIYRQHDTPHRVSARKDHAAVEANVRIVEWVYGVISLREDLPLARQALSRQAFELAGEAYHLEYSDLGLRAEMIWRRLGPPYRKTGSWMHRVGVAILGFERKAALARRASKLRQN